jgi:hypothetical protein
MRNTKLPVLAAAIAVMGLMGALASSASADSLTCEISGSISLYPGLSETPKVQSVKITNPGAKLTNCTGTETIVTGGFLWVKGTQAETTKEAITCQALKGPGAALEHPAGNPGQTAGFRWHPKIPGDRFNGSAGFVNVPITENPVSLSGNIFPNPPIPSPFQEDKITGSVTEKYSGTCGGSPPGAAGPARWAYPHPKRKITKGTFTGTITIS